MLKLLFPVVINSAWDVESIVIPSAPAAGATCNLVAGPVVPIPTKPSAPIVIPELVAVNAPPRGVMRNLLLSESSAPNLHAETELIWKST